MGVCCAGFGTALTVIVEVSSRFQQFNAPTIAILWTVLDRDDREMK